MLISTVIALLGALGIASAAAVIPARQAPPASSPPDSRPPCSPVWVYTYVYFTVTAPPQTVTIAAVDSNSIIQAFSSKAGVDTIQIEQSIQDAPVGNPPNTAPDQFTHTASAPLYEATEAPGGGKSVYYVAEPNNSPQATPVATTTVTVVPTPAAPHAEDHVYSTITNTSFRTATLTSPASRYGNWSLLLANTSVVAVGLSTGGYGIPNAPSEASGVLTTTLTTYIATTTKNLSNLSATSTLVNASFTGYGVPTGVISHTSPQPAGLVPRQTCTLVDAGPFGQWCNNWDGSNTTSYSTYNTTVTPAPKHTSPLYSVNPKATEVPTATVTVTASAAPNQSSTNDQPEPGQPEQCGETGAFVIGFDNLPEFSTHDNNTNLHPPVFNPFEHFWWGDCWTYAPPPNEPYPPNNGTAHLAQCIPTNNNTLIGSPNAAAVPETGFGAYSRADNNAYWFDARSAYVACDNNATNISVTCQFDVTAWQWDGTREVILCTDRYTIQPCPNNVDCHLQQISFPDTYNGLTTLNFSATVGGQSRSFYMDSLALDWYNNTCDAGLLRISSRKV